MVLLGEPGEGPPHLPLSETELPRAQGTATGGAGLALQPLCRRGNTCGRCSLPPALRSVAVSEQDAPAAPSREFPLPVTPACPGSWAPGWGRKLFRPPHTPRHTPVAAVQPPCAARPAVLFHAFSTKQLFLHPRHVRARRRAWEAGGGLSRSTLAACIGLLSHTVWGSLLCLILVISIQMGPRWPSLWCSCRRVRSVSGSRGVGGLHVRVQLPLRLVP